MIDSDIAQTIVDKTISILGRNINIMNSDAIIIASGEVDRIGTYHNGAARVIENGYKTEIDEHEAKNLKDIKPGINLPINYGNKIIGVVGITGKPEEIREFGELLRHTVEIMLEQSDIKDRINIKRQAKEVLFQELINGKWKEQSVSFIQRAEYLGYDLNITRKAIVIDLNSNNKISPVTFQKKKMEIKNKILNLFDFNKIRENIIVGFTINSHIVILLPYKKIKLKQDDKKILYQLLKSLSLEINSYIKDEGNISIGVGEKYEKWTKIQKSYKQACYAIKLGEVFKSNNNKGGVYFFEDLITEYCLTYVSKDFQQKYSQQILNDLTNNKLNEYNQDLFHTLQVYLENDMSINLSAKKLFIHRNTMRFRLNKIYKMTGYNPILFQDAYKFKIAIIMKKLNLINIDI